MLLQYMEVACPIYMVHKIVVCICMRSSTNEEVNYSLRDGTETLEEEGLILEE